MHFNYGTLAITALTFASLGKAHLIMKSPVPFGVSTLNNSPLNDAKPGTSQSDFPCKQRPGVYDITKMNHMAVEEPQELSFIGSASHGGGTCQIAVTMDKKPDYQSTFKIIQVFEGGCPIDSDGNGGTHPFTFSIPKDMPNGVMTLAWVWYNRIGNREIYMNCAPITVTGGGDNQTYFDSLPNLYKINMPTEECESTFQSESNAVTIPHPGQFIMKETSGQQMHAATGPGCAAAAAAQLDGVKGYQDAVVPNNAAYHAPGGAAAPSAPASGSAGAPSGSAAPSAPASSGSPSSAAGGASSAVGSAAPSGAPSSAAAGGSSGLVSMSVAPSGGASGSAGAPSASAAPSAPAGSSAAAPSVSAAPSGSMAASGSAPAPSAPAASGSSSCSDSSGGMSCSGDGKQFGVCSNGAMVWRDVAPGTTCSNGSIVKRAPFRNPHVRRHIRRELIH